MRKPPTHVTVLGRVLSGEAAERARAALADHLQARVQEAEADGGRIWIVSGVAPAYRAPGIATSLRARLGDGSDWMLQDVWGESGEDHAEAERVLAERLEPFSADTDGYLLMVRAGKIITALPGLQYEAWEADDGGIGDREMAEHLTRKRRELQEILAELDARGERSRWALTWLEDHQRARAEGSS